MYFIRFYFQIVIHHQAITMLQALFLIITILSIVLFYLASEKNAKVLGYYLLWLLVVGAVSYSGFLKDTSTVPPKMLLVLVPAIISVLFFVATLKNVAINSNYLLAIHALRLPVEITLHQLYVEGKVPAEMTFLGWNFDILMGISAIALLLYAKFSKHGLNPVLYKVWNIIGIGFLATIVTIAVLSTPLPIQQLAFNQPNIAILEFPYTYLPAIVVPIVLIAHILGLRQGIILKQRG